MAFWTAEKGALGKDPKRGFRFKVTMTTISDPTHGSIIWWAKTVDKPSFETSVTEHDYLNHKFKFPAKTTWNPVTMKMVDPTSPDMVATFSALITAAGYHPPTNADDQTSMSKALATLAVGDVVISQIDAMGKTLEEWTLHNAFITKVTYGNLDYSSEDLTEVEVEFVYDWAELRVKTDGSVHKAESGAGNAQAPIKKEFWVNQDTDPYKG